MSKIIFAALLCSASNAFAFDVNLHEGKSITVEELMSLEAETVTCGKLVPRCVLQGEEYGIHYPGQDFSEILLTKTYSAKKAKEELLGLREAGLCN